MHSSHPKPAVANGSFDSGVSMDIELEGVPDRHEAENDPGGYASRDWYTFNITGNHPSFPDNHSFSYQAIGLKYIQAFLYNVLEQTIMAQKMSMILLAASTTGH